MSGGGHAESHRVFDAYDSRLSSALARINGKMLALQSRIAKFAGAFLAIRAATGVVTAGFDHFKQALEVGGSSPALAIIALTPFPPPLLSVAKQILEDLPILHDDHEVLPRIGDDIDVRDGVAVHE
jgi:hypothetical protein